jgi:hypothetical protein
MDRQPCAHSIVNLAAPHATTDNAIAPSGVETSAFRQFVAGLAPEQLDALWQIIPLRRLKVRCACNAQPQRALPRGEIINASGGTEI